MSNKFISIVTINLNNKAGLESTIHSVMNQDQDLFDFIIVDGGSIDGSLDVINSSACVFMDVISERDDGVYDAMNKGLSKVTTEWVMFLNSGDRLLSGPVLESLSKAAIEFRKSNMLFGDRLDEGGVLYKAYPPEVLKGGLIFGCHQSMIFKTKVFGKNISYDNRYRIYSDYDLAARLYKLDPSGLKYLNIPLVIYEGGGISTLGKYKNRKRMEKFHSAYNVFGLRFLYHFLKQKIIEPKRYG